MSRRRGQGYQYMPLETDEDSDDYDLEKLFDVRKHQTFSQRLKDVFTREPKQPQRKRFVRQPLKPPKRRIPSSNSHVLDYVSEQSERREEDENLLSIEDDKGKFSKLKRGVDHFMMKLRPHPVVGAGRPGERYGIGLKFVEVEERIKNLNQNLINTGNQLMQIRSNLREKFNDQPFTTMITDIYNLYSDLQSSYNQLQVELQHIRQTFRDNSEIMSTSEFDKNISPLLMDKIKRLSKRVTKDEKTLNTIDSNIDRLRCEDLDSRQKISYPSRWTFNQSGVKDRVKKLRLSEQQRKEKNELETNTYMDQFVTNDQYKLLIIRLTDFKAKSREFNKRTNEVLSLLSEIKTNINKFSRDNRSPEADEDLKTINAFIVKIEKMRSISTLAAEEVLKYMKEIGLHKDSIGLPKQASQPISEDVEKKHQMIDRFSKTIENFRTAIYRNFYKWVPSVSMSTLNIDFE